MKRYHAFPLVPALLAASSALAEQSGEELAKKSGDPVAALISVPMQLNYDQNIGPNDGERWTLNVLPVVPITFHADWNLISRTISASSASSSPVWTSRAIKARNGHGSSSDK